MNLKSVYVLFVLIKFANCQDDSMFSWNFAEGLNSITQNANNQFSNVETACRDNFNWCSSSTCNHPNRNYCKKSCGLCEGQQEQPAPSEFCNDELTWCEMRFCSSYGEHCRRTCNLCSNQEQLGDSSTTTPPETVTTQGPIWVNPNPFFQQRPRPPPPPPPEECPKTKLNFPRESSKDYVRIKKTLKPSSKYTVCAVADFTNTKKLAGSLMSYATIKVPNCMSIIKESGGVTAFYYNGQKLGTISDFGVRGRHCICTVFCGDENGQVRAKIYINGALVKTLSVARKKDAQIEGKGVVIVGQDQDSIAGGFQSSQSYKGCIEHFRIWQRELTRDQIKLACDNKYCKDSVIDAEEKGVQVGGAASWSED